MKILNLPDVLPVLQPHHRYPNSKHFIELTEGVRTGFRIRIRVGSVFTDPDPCWIRLHWIQIRILNTDPDPGVQKALFLRKKVIESL